MKSRLIRSLMGLLAVAVSSKADTYRGTITWSLTTLNDAPDNTQVGDTFNGWYSYESPSSDGEFYNSGLSGGIGVPTWMASGESFLSFSSHNITLTVLDNAPSLGWGCDWGPLSMNFETTSMNFGVFGIGVDGNSVTGTGAVLISEPFDDSVTTSSGDPASVPDSGVSVLLVGLGSVMLFLARKQAADRAK